MRACIIGAGITGLTTAYRLSQKGHKVVVFEKEKFPGGLLAGFKEKGWDWHLEHFYHHLFTSDQAAQGLISELGFSDKLFFGQPKTSIFYENRVARFDSPLSLFTFPHLSTTEKIRTGLVTSYLKLNPFWKNLEKITAASWLPKYYGGRPYRLLWKPLLNSKFGNESGEISMAWFWSRVNKRSSHLGYLKGGFQIVIDELIRKTKKQGGEIILNHEVKSLEECSHHFDKIIVTVPASAFLKLTPNFPEDYRKTLQGLKMFGSINLILVLKERFLIDNTYWLNINESGFPFVAVVEHTNFINPIHYGGSRILYVGGYYPQTHQYFKMGGEDILREFLPYLKKINPDHKLEITNYFLSKNLYAQPLVPIDYSQLIPPHTTPFPQVYLFDMQQVYPWDRGMNYAIELGEKAAQLLS